MKNNINYGYCCINTQLQKEGITTSRSMKKATFEEKGLNYVSELSIQNISDLLKTLQWNLKNNIFNYRITSELFPWMSNYELIELPKFNTIKASLKIIGNFVKENKIRVTFHPGPYTVLASENKETVTKSIKEINQHAEIFDLMGLDCTPFYCINIHLNSTKPSKEEVINRFCENFSLLSISAQNRLTIENDDFVNQYSVQDLYKVATFCNIPIVFDQYHFLLGPKDLSMEESMKLAISTWKDIKPLIHLSSCRKEEDLEARVHAHSDYIYYQPNLFGFEVDIDLECKMKEVALQKFLIEKDNLPLISDMSVAKRLLEMSSTDSKRREYSDALGFTIPKVKELSVKKGDKIQTDRLSIGIIIKYPSNKEITIQFDDNSTCVISKENIKRIL